MVAGGNRAVIRTIVSRSASGVVTLLLVLLLGFTLLQMLPGDALRIDEDPSLTVEDRERMRRALGLDRPAHLQLLTFAAHALRADLGVSLSYQRPVADVLADAIGPTVLLSGAALLVAFGLGCALGTRAALRPGGVSQWLVRRVLPALDALPPFWLGLLAIYFFAWKLGWLPASHMTSPGRTPGALLDLLRHLLLPALVLGVPAAAPVARHQAAALERELARPWVRAWSGCGIRSGRIARGAIRSALHPVIALLGLSLPALVGGAVVVEVVFSWPGLGRVHQQALLSQDVPLALGGLMLIGALVIAGGVLADLLSGLADPRWRKEGA
jgi:peptide/nickel transport system permease protein